MLSAARTLKEKGTDAVIGYVEPHLRADTIKLTEGFETIPVRTVEYKGITLSEFDVDAALVRRPRLVLVDELAHTNAAGSKHKKRYMDVEELINAGIDVFTTVNVQHLESLNDIVAEATGVTVSECIPDTVFDSADEVELVDIEPEELEERLRSGKIYRKDAAATALENFFTKEKLDSLRETAMRRTADRIEKKSSDRELKPRILVLVSPSPSSAKNIRSAARLAEISHTKFCAVYVERSGELAAESASNIKNHLRLVKNLGGELSVRYGDDVIDVIASFVKLNGITTIILGKTWQSAGKKPGFEDRIIAAFPDVEILIIPDSCSSSHPKGKRNNAGQTAKNSFLHIFGRRQIVFLVCGVLWCAGAFLFQIFSPGAAVFAETAAAVFFCACLIYRSVAAEKVRICYSQTNRALDAFQAIDRAVAGNGSRETETPKAVAEELCKTVSGIFGKSVQLSVFPEKSRISAAADRQTEGTGSTAPAENETLTVQYGLSGEDISFFSNQTETAVAQWCRANGKPAGRGTDTLRSASAAYYPVIAAGRCAAVIGLSCAKESGLSVPDRLLLVHLESRLAAVCSAIRP